MNVALAVMLFKTQSRFNGFTIAAAQVGAIIREVESQKVDIPQDVLLAAKSLHAALIAARDDAGKDIHVGTHRSSAR